MYKECDTYQYLNQELNQCQDEPYLPVFTADTIHSNSQLCQNQGIWEGEGCKCTYEWQGPFCEQKFEKDMSETITYRAV